MKRTLSLVLALIMVLGTFTGVFAAEAQETAVDVLEREGVLLGDNDGDLMLDKNLERREAVVLLSRLFDVESEAKSFDAEGYPTWADVSSDAYFVPFFAWAEVNKYFEGDDEGNFRPREDITAQDYSVVLLRALKYDVSGDAAWRTAYEDAKELGLLADVDAEEKEAILRSEMAVMTFNALGTAMYDTDMTLAEYLDIEMPEAEKATELEVVEVYTENLAEIRVKLSNAELVETEDALYNPSNYRLEKTDAEVQHVHLDGDEVVLTLVPYGRIDEDRPAYDVLKKGKSFDLTIRNIHPAINKSYKNNMPIDNTLPVVENVEFLGDYGIKVTTSEPIKNPQERDFRLDSRTSMIVEQYGRDIILTPYHDKAFDKDADELTIDILNDYSEYRTVKEYHEMELSSDDALPEVVKAYRSGSKLVVEFDRDVYHKSIKAYESRRELGNVSFNERRVPFYATDAVKVDTNVVEYTFEREIPRNIEVVIENVANHFNKAMETETIVPVEYKDDYAPVVISTNHNVTITQAFEDDLVAFEAISDDKLQEELNKGFEATTGKTTVIFDKDIAQFEAHIAWEKDNTKGKEIDVNDYFKLYELDITRKGEAAASEVVINNVKVLKDRIELSYENIKVNNKHRDFDYILEVKNLSDLNGNRMDREYLDFVVSRISDSFDVVVEKIRPNSYFNRDGIEIILKFNYPVNREEASNAKNYYLDGKLKVDEAIVERDGKTVSLVVYDTNETDFKKDYQILEISPRVQRLASPNPSVANRFWDLTTDPIKATTDPAKDAAYAKALAEIKEDFVKNNDPVVMGKLADTLYVKGEESSEEFLNKVAEAILAQLKNGAEDVAAASVKGRAEEKINGVEVVVTAEFVAGSNTKIEYKASVSNGEGITSGELVLTKPFEAKAYTLSFTSDVDVVSIYVYDVDTNIEIVANAFGEYKITDIATINYIAKAVDFEDATLEKGILIKEDQKIKLNFVPVED